ncbi:MAG TPA: ABC transporter permease [Acetobacteraceae bacterium]|jgi:peptide/nickel transport system permease protein|nr:ABC transporter permease [Acetobacteraceae bacterium]
MFGFILSRILQAIPVLLIVGLIAYAMFTFVGDPVTSMVGQNFTAEQRAMVVHELGLDQPFIVQYAKFIWQALHGNFGISYRLGRPVGTLILERFPATAELAATAAVFSLVIGLPLGVYTAIRRDSASAKAMMVLSLMGVSLPTFLIGILLILIFSVALGWLPSFGRGDVVHFAHWSTGFLTISGLRSLILPAIMLGMFQMALIMRLVRSEMLEVLRSDYVKFARARGLSTRAINYGHALKNTMVPVITIVGLQLGMLLAFSIITETVFQWPGMGLLLVQSIGVADIPVMSAYLMLIAVVFVVLNLIVDLLYFVVDPRLRLTRLSTAPVR